MAHEGESINQSMSFKLKLRQYFWNDCHKCAPHYCFIMHFYGCFSFVSLVFSPR